MRFRAWRSSLRLNLLGLIGLLLAAVTLFNLAFFPAWLRSFSRGWEERRALSMGLAAAGSATRALAVDQAGALQPVLGGMEAVAEVKYAGIFRPDGTVAAAVHRELLPDKPPVVLKGSVAAVANGLEVRIPLPTTRGSGLLLVGMSLAQVDSDTRGHLAMVALFSLLLIVLGVVAALVAARLLVRPIEQLTAAAQQIVRAGDLRQKIAVDSRDEIGELARCFQQMIDRLHQMAATLAGGLNELTQAAESVNALTRMEREAVEKQASGLSAAGAAVQQLKSTSGMAAKRAKDVTEMAAQASKLSGAGQLAVEATRRSLEEVQAQASAVMERTKLLSQSTLQIAGIVASVKDIADQSNLLALNAAMEAARAGEAGAGFAVVAREVRLLSDQSLEATNRIRQILVEVQKAIRQTLQSSESGAKRMEESVGEIQSSGDSLRKMTQVVQESSQAVHQIAHAVDEQDEGIGQVMDGILSLNHAMNRVTGSISEAEKASLRLQGLAERIRGVVGELRI